jgi:hypothetical protein
MLLMRGYHQGFSFAHAHQPAPTPIVWFERYSRTFEASSINYIYRGGNRAGRIGFGFESDGSDQFDFLEEIGSDRVGSIYMLCLFISLLDFDWIKGHLISGRVGSGRVQIGSDQFDFFKKLDRIGSDSDRIQIRTDRTSFSDRVGFCHL